MEWAIWSNYVNPQTWKYKGINKLSKYLINKLCFQNYIAITTPNCSFHYFNLSSMRHGELCKACFLLSIIFAALILRICFLSIKCRILLFLIFFTDWPEQNKLWKLSDIRKYFSLPIILQCLSEFSFSNTNVHSVLIQLG